MNMAQPSIVMTIVAFLLMLGPLVTLHELGHYLVGRWCGVHAEVFSVGFGRELLGWTDKRGTRWRLSALPLGGYVKFAGDMNAASMPIDDIPLDLAERERCFQFKPLWQRAAIVFAGPLANLLIAVAIFSAFYLAYGRMQVEPVIGAFVEPSAAHAAGLQVGDRITAIDGTRVDQFEDIMPLVLVFPGQTRNVTVERKNARLTVPVRIAISEEQDILGNKGQVGRLNIRPDLTHARIVSVGPFEAVARAGTMCVDMVSGTITGIGQIITGQRSVREMGGPVRIARYSGAALSMGWQSFVRLAGVISINLAFINLLPIPGLDGGHLAFYAVEAVRRRALSVRSQEWALRTGLAFLLALIVFVTINDVVPASLFGR